MLTARPLSIWETVFCWRLAHDTDVRESAIDRSYPTVLGHLRWMASWLFKGDRQAWVIIVTECAGLARVQCDGTVSIEVLPEYRGRGVALFGVQVATNFAIGRGWATPVAYIRADNKASIGLFARAGYEMAGATDGWVTMEKAA